MIFNINITKDIDSRRLMFNLASKYPRCFGGILTVVDTGSPRTIISARDAFILKIPVSNFPEAPEIKGFGRGGIPCRKIESFKFYIKSDENQIRNIDMPLYVVDITRLHSLNQDMINNAYKVPSIMGLDFLTNLNLKLVVDLKNNQSYFQELNSP
jgi:hypothetical protein